MNDVGLDVELERQLGYARDRAIEASRLKSEFLANISHEIRTPLNGVIGFASLLLDSPLNADQREQVLTLRTAGQQLLSLLNDVLDLSKVEAGRMSLEEIAFDVTAWLAETVQMHASAAFDKGLPTSRSTGRTPSTW
ncbi:MAG: histidine kinase dimerization/phospho-acceptor domain-containing protein [Egibacteraceae bacterium]